MKLKVSYKSQLYALKDLIFISVIYFGGIFFLQGILEMQLFKIIFISTFFLYLVAFFLPVVLLHFNYLIKGECKEVIIKKNKFILGNSLYSFNEIEFINIYATYQHFNESVGVSTLPYNDYYFYIKIHLNGNRTIILSSLIDYKIDQIFIENFPSVKIIKKPSTYVSLFIK